MPEIRYVGENRVGSTLRSKFHVWLRKFLGSGEKEEVRSGNQEEEYINCAGQVEHYDAEKRGRRRYVGMTNFQPSRYGDGKDDEGICNRVTDDLIIYEPCSLLER